MSIISTLLILIFGLNYCHSSCNYKGYQLLKILPSTEQHLRFIKELARSELLHHAEFWMRPSIPGIPVLIMAKKDIIGIIRIEFTRRNMSASVHVNDLDDFVDSSGSDISNEKGIFKPKMAAEDFDLDAYHNLDEIEAYYNSLIVKFPHLLSKINVGFSFEGRNLWLLKIGERTGGNKVGFYLECGIHPREWITHASCLYILSFLLNSWALNREIDFMLISHDWYIMPVSNPDGYVYSWTTDRFWRKSRSYPNLCANQCRANNDVWNASMPVMCKGCCKGVDLNRNWNIYWGVTDSCPHPCCLTYAGTGPGSEPEIQAISNFLYKYRHNITMFLAVHAYSQMWMYPYSYKKGKLPSNSDTLKKLSQAVIKAIKNVHGQTYESGAAFQIMYESSGTSMDWVRNATQIPYTFSIELRPSHRRTFELPAFCLPETEIKPTSDELFAALKTLYFEISNLSHFPSVSILINKSFSVRSVFAVLFMFVFILYFLF